MTERHPAKTCPAPGCDGLMLPAGTLLICADCAYVRDTETICPACGSDLRDADGIWECRACGHVGPSLADIEDTRSPSQQAREVLALSQRRGKRGSARSRGRYPSPQRQRLDAWRRKQRWYRQWG